MQSFESPIRFAIYARYSTEYQSDISLEAQEYACRGEIDARGGTVIAVYTDSAKTGWSLERDGFNELRAAAARGEFDAIMFWKFDRLARSHEQALMIKLLLRHEYGLKLFCVEGYSADDDDSEESARMEQLFAVFAAFYSKNLSTDSRRAKHHRALRGEFNGSIAPLGYVLVTQAQATPQRPAGLYINPRAAALVRRAFKFYATGEYSDASIAKWLNQFGYIQRLREGKKPIGLEMVREMLQNRVYTGRVQAVDMVNNQTINRGKLARRGQGEWLEGKHEGFISDELFEMCQEVRGVAARQFNKKPSTQQRIYLLSSLLRCGRCMEMKPEGLTHAKYAHMRAGYDHGQRFSYYFCPAHIHGFDKCGQKVVKESIFVSQVLFRLANLRLSPEERARAEREIGKRIEFNAASTRMKEIGKLIRQLGLDDETSILDQQIHEGKQFILKNELERMRPMNIDPYQRARDLLDNFMVYWDACQDDKNPQFTRQQLIASVVQEIHVYDTDVTKVILIDGVIC